MSAPEVGKSLRIVLLTGLSGSGKSTAAKALEDLGFFVVDNLPSGLLETFLTLLDRSVLEKVALVMDIRDAGFPRAFPGILEAARRAGYRPEVVFFEAKVEALRRRFSETRRKHPLDTNGDLGAAIKSERDLLGDVRERADLVIDTTELNVHQLKKRIVDEFSHAKAQPGEMTIRFVSFGFRYGAPHDADVVMDVRFLPNPHFVPALREKDGKDDEVAEKVLDSDDGKTFMEKFGALLQFLLPRYRSEGKAYLTIGIGCTGGRHRSVAVSERLAEQLRSEGHAVHVIHRDLERA